MNSSELEQLQSKYESLKKSTEIVIKEFTKALKDSCIIIETQRAKTDKYRAQAEKLAAALKQMTDYNSELHPILPRIRECAEALADYEKFKETGE